MTEENRHTAAQAAPPTVRFIDEGLARLRRGAGPQPSRDPSVYIAHAMADEMVATRIARRLAARGYRVERDSAAAADVILALWSEEAATSRWVLPDADAASRRDALVEALIDPIASPLERSGRLPPVDLTEGRGDVRGPGWEALNQRLDEVIGGPRSPISKEAVAMGGTAVAMVMATIAVVVGAPTLTPDEADSKDNVDVSEMTVSADFGTGGPALDPFEPANAPGDDLAFDAVAAMEDAEVLSLERLKPLPRPKFAPLDAIEQPEELGPFGPELTGPPP